MQRFSWLLPSAVCAACTATGPASPLDPTDVLIVRDEWGVPHVYGPTDAGVALGLGYAQAEDDFPRIERNYTWALGRLAEVEGESALYSDLRARLYMTEIQAREAYASAPDWLKALCIAFADGLN